jgi:hypothetical protein
MDQETKKSQDNYAEVGSFQVTLTAPSENSSTITSGGSLNVAANNTNGNASYNLKSNGSSLDKTSNSKLYL